MGLTEKIQQIVLDALKGSRITSASPGHINEVIDTVFTTSPNIDNEIENLIKENKIFSGLGNTKEKVEQMEKGNVGKIMAMSSAELGVLQSFMRNPGGFVFGTVMRKFAKGAGAVTLAVILFETIKIVMEEFFKPGRIFDTRFRETIDRQILVFMDRKEQQELRQGFKSVITTTILGLRGSSLAGQIGGNFYNPDRIPVNFLDRRLVRSNIIPSNPQMRNFIDPTRATGVMG